MVTQPFQESESVESIPQAGGRAGAKPPRAGEAITIESVGKTFDDGTVAVENADFSVAAGEFVSIVGPSGCGKSTVLRMLAGLIPPTEGQLTLGGSNVEGPRQDVGMMFQKPTLLPWLTSLQNTLLPRELNSKADDSATAEACELLSMLGLEGFEHSYPQHLSGGMQQRVALARMLMIGAPVLLLDEPFAAVDELTRERLNIELLEIHSRLQPTIVLITHNITEAFFLADRVFVMSNRPGRIVEEITVPFQRPRSVDITGEAVFGELTLKARKLLGTVEVS